MIVLGTIFVAMALLSAYLLFKNKLWDSKWFLKLMLFSIPLPHIAIQTGWMAAEIGRQPWAVYSVLKTADAASVVVPAWQVLFTLIMFVIIYTLAFVIFMKLILKTIRKGPEQIKQYSY
jgi:cytochrome d ubiquinol oxidase subunit I